MVFLGRTCWQRYRTHTINVGILRPLEARVITTHDYENTLKKYNERKSSSHHYYNAGQYPLITRPQFFLTDSEKTLSWLLHV
ncbi:MAG: hypothetical protein ACTSRA_14700 [Promethearchaeota archaeon]